jgi:hypothetical protein
VPLPFELFDDGQYTLLGLRFYDPTDNPDADRRLVLEACPRDPALPHFERTLASPLTEPERDFEALAGAYMARLIARATTGGLRPAANAERSADAVRDMTEEDLVRLEAATS